MGEVQIQGSKNGALPLLTATILIHGKTVLHNCPKISDIDAMVDLLQAIGCQVETDKNIVVVDATHICDTHCPQKQVQAMRSSIMLLGPLLGRCKRVEMNRPGGCVIGKRPTDIHELALRQMNVTFETDGDIIIANTYCLTGADIVLPFPSVGVTENVVMAAAVAEGTTRLYNAAKEPEITQLCMFLRKAGAKIKGIGSSVLEIVGVKVLREVSMTIMPDRIVAGTYLLAAAATRGQVILRGSPTEQMYRLLEILRAMGAVVFADKDMICMDGEKADRPIPYVCTQVYPGFPTDLQSMLVAALVLSKGQSVVEEAIFEGRFRIVSQLKKMGADISEEGNIARISGVKHLHGAKLEACELRGGAALVIAALSCAEESHIYGDCYIKRGYEDIVRDIKKLGGDIEYITGEDDVSI